MKAKIKYIVVTACLLLIAGPRCHAQRSVEDVARIDIKHVKIGLVESGDSLSIRMIISANDLRVKKDRSLTMAIILAADNRQVELPPVVYAGDVRYRFDIRNEISGVKENHVKPVRTFAGVKKNRNYALEYNVRLPFAQWMGNASVYTEYRYNDCCSEKILGHKTVIAGTEEHLRGSGRVTATSEESPATAHIPTGATGENKKMVAGAAAPIIATAQKTEREEKAAAKVDFSSMVYVADRPLKPQRAAEKNFRAVLYYRNNETVLDPYFGRNLTELKRLDDALGSLSAGNAVPSRITVTGYASPEGSYLQNEMLAMSRSLDMAGYLRDKYGAGESSTSVAWVAEDWDGLQDIIDADLPYYSVHVERIIRSFGIFDGREKALMDLNGGTIYNSLMGTSFPKLRRVVITAHIPERVIMLKQKEEMLLGGHSAVSLDEVFAVAGQYAPHEVMYRRVFEAAAAIYPHEPEVNNNAAGACLLGGDMSSAAVYLGRTGESPVSYVNRGVYHYMKGNADEAAEWFGKAAKKDQPKGAANLRIMENTMK